MQIRIATKSYNTKHYGRPWIARVTFRDVKGEFEFGTWIGKHGRDGLLELDAEPGDIIAYGQKCLRSQESGYFSHYILQEDGTRIAVSKADAYIHYKDRHEATPDKAALCAERERLLQRLAEIDAQLA